MNNEISDLIEVATNPEANMELLLKDAYNRGFSEGKDSAKSEVIEFTKRI